MSYKITVIAAHTYDRHHDKIDYATAKHAVEAIAAKVTALCGGVTYHARHGAWKSPQGAIVTECVHEFDGLILPLKGENEGQIKRRARAIGQELAEYAKVLLNQEAVTLIVTRCYGEFV